MKLIDDELMKQLLMGHAPCNEFDSDAEAFRYRKSIDFARAEVSRDGFVVARRTRP